MNFWGRTLHKETVVIGVYIVKIEVHKSEDIDIGKIRMHENIGRDKIEVIRIEGEFCVEVFAHIAEMAKLVDECRSTMVSLKLS